MASRTVRLLAELAQEYQNEVFLAMRASSTRAMAP